MSKKSVTETIKTILDEFLKENDYELYNIEYVKKGKDRFLRLFIDRIWEEGIEKDGIGIDDCEKVSKYLSDKLDESDIIKDKYYLEVSSPGMDRPLIKDQHYRRYKGSRVEIKLYNSLNGQKKFVGILGDADDEKVEIITDNGSTVELPKEAIAKAKLR